MKTLIKHQPISIIPYEYPQKQGDKNSSSKTYSDLATKIYRLREEVFKVRPILKEIFDNNHHKSIYEYERSQMQENTSATPLVRKSEFLEILNKEITKQLGAEVAKKAIKQLEKYYYVSTTLHHGPLSHPNITNALIATALPYIFDDTVDLTSIIVLACSNISFDNSLTDPRGISFNNTYQNAIQKNHITVFPRKVRPFPLFNYVSYTQESIDNAKKTLQTRVKEGAVTTEQADKVISILDQVYGDKEILSLSNYSDQATRTNYKLFKQFMSFGKKLPDLVYLNQERIVLDLLSNYHMTNATSINKLLFSPKYHDLAEKYFNNISGAFSLEKHSGTFLFWAIPTGEKYRMQLWRKGDTLTTEDGTYSIKLTPEELKKAVDNRELIPSTLLSFITLSFYYGLRLIGGLNQPTYFTQMKKAYIALQKEAGDLEEISVYENLPTDSMSFWRPLLAFVANKSGEKTPATGIDVILNAKEDFWEKMKKFAQTITIGDALHRALPGVYKTYYPYDKQEESMIAIGESDIERVIGMNKKVSPIAQI